MSKVRNKMARLRKSTTHNKCYSLFAIFIRLKLASHPRERNINVPIQYTSSFHFWADSQHERLIKEYRRVAKQKRSIR